MTRIVLLINANPFFCSMMLSFIQGAQQFSNDPGASPELSPVTLLYVLLEYFNLSFYFEQTRVLRALCTVQVQ